MNWEDVYDQNIWEDRKEAPELIQINKLMKIKEEKILDIGCGYGRISIPLFEQGANIICIDCVDEPLRVVKTKCDGKIETVKCKSDKLPLPDNMFDGIIAVNSIYHNNLKGFSDSILEMNRVLKNGGWLYCTFLSTKDYKYGLGKEIENNVFISTEGPDIGVPHVYVDESTIKSLFVNWKDISLKEDIKRFDNVESAHFVLIAKK